MQPSPTTPRAAALLALAVVVVALLVGGAVAVAGDLVTDPQPRLRPVADRALVAPRDEVRAAHLLEEWDARRSQAWADGDAEALVALYTPGSAAGDHDRAMLAAWLARGLKVQGLRTQLVAVTVVARRPGRWELDVVDRVVDGVAVGAGVRRALPQDDPTARRVVVVEGPTGWLVESVGPVGPGSPVSAARSPAPR